MKKAKVQGKEKQNDQKNKADRIAQMKALTRSQIQMRAAKRVINRDNGRHIEKDINGQQQSQHIGII